MFNNMDYTLDEISQIKEGLNSLFQECQDKQVCENFKCFHKYLVDSVIAFCKINGLTNIDGINLEIDNLQSSISYGEWKPWTDSSLRMFEKDNNSPYLYNI